MNSDTDATEFNQLLPGDDESPDQRRERRARLERLCTRSPERCTVLVWDLTQQIAVMKAQCATNEAVVRELQEIQQEQSRLINKLTAPPWHSALFVRRAETASCLLAEVLHNGSRRLVQMGEEIDIEALVEGQVVYLGHELNAILGVAPTELHGVGEIAAVERVLDGDWLVLRDRDLRMQVRQSRRLIHTDLAPGDSVRWNREAMLALERVESSSSDDLFCTETLTAHSTEKLGGLGPEVEQVIALFTQCIAQPEMAARYGLNRGNTLLMHGPPGNGKTSIARIVGSALAAATGGCCRFAYVKGAQLESSWVGESQAAIQALFEEMRRDDCPTLLFIDEVEAIGRTRGGLSAHHSDKFLGTWLTEIDGLIGLPGTLGIVASTNRKDLIDPALLERLSGTELFIDRPRREAAREVFDIHLPPTLPYGPNGAEAMHTREAIIAVAVDTLYSPNGDNTVARLQFRDGSSRTVTAAQMLSGRSIEQICLRARRSAFRRHTESGTPGVRVEDMEESVTDALDRLASSLSPVNARAMLSNLPQDLDVVSVEPVRRVVKAYRYRQRAASGGG